MSNFETRSAALFATALLATAVVHAQTGSPTPDSRNSPPSQMSPSATPSAGGTSMPDSIPRNKVTSQDLDAIFMRADANKDGKLDMKEAGSLPAVAQNFERLDSNRDTFISREEFSQVAGS